MTLTHYATTPPRRSANEAAPRPGTRLRLPARLGLGAGVPAAAAILWAQHAGTLPAAAAVTLIVFLAAIWLWLFTRIDDAFVAVAVAAAVVLVLAGALPTHTFTGTLGSELIWLLVGACAIAAAVTASGLAQLAGGKVMGWARSPRQLVHLCTAFLTLTCFLIPSTSGRAALAVPLFLVLAASLHEHHRLVRCLALVFPIVIVFSAVGSLLGAGAHLIAAEMILAATGNRFGFLDWAALGFPLALVWAHLAAEVCLLVFTDRSDRGRRLARVGADDAGGAEGTGGVEDAGGSRADGPAGTGATTPPALNPAQRWVIWVLAAVVAGWLTEPWHGVSPAIVGLIGALLATAPGRGPVSLSRALREVPWSLLVFMAATLAMGYALVNNGAAAWLAATIMAPAHHFGGAAPAVFIAAVILVSLLAHLVVQSRSARAAILIPVFMSLAPGFGVGIEAVVLLSTAAAGYCITLSSSAKPVAMFAQAEAMPLGYRGGDLLRVSALLAPISAVLIALWAFYYWPLLGLTVGAG